MIGNLIESSSSNYVKEESDYLEESDSDEMSDNERDMIDPEDEEELGTESANSHASSSPNELFDRSQREPTDLPADPSTNSPADVSTKENLHNAVARAKNIIAFFRALYNEQYFRNIDPSYFAVISDGKLIGICENEEIARQVAAQTNIKIGDQIGDGMVFPISGNFKSRRNEHFDLPI